MTYDSEKPGATFKDGRTLDRDTVTAVVAAGAYHCTFTFDMLEHVTGVLEVIVTKTDPLTCVDGIVRGAPSGNTVGTTICGIAAGTTLTAEAWAIGW